MRLQKNVKGRKEGRKESRKGGGKVSDVKNTCVNESG